MEAKAKLLTEKKAIQEVMDSGKKNERAILDALDRRMYRDLINAFAILSKLSKEVSADPRLTHHSLA